MPLRALEHPREAPNTTNNMLKSGYLLNKSSYKEIFYDTNIYINKLYNCAGKNFLVTMLIIKLTRIFNLVENFENRAKIPENFEEILEIFRNN